MPDTYSAAAYDYASAACGDTSWYSLLTATNLLGEEVPVEYAGALPWEDIAGSLGWNSEDIAALYHAGVSPEWASAFHDGLSNGKSISHASRLHIDEMVYPIAVYRAGIEAEYAAACARRHLSVEATIRLHRTMPLEYLEAVL